MILRDENMNKIENEMYELSEKVRENRSIEETMKGHDHSWHNKEAGF